MVRGKAVRLVFRNFREEAIEWQPTDYRFTCRDQTVYALAMGAKPGKVAVIRSLDEGEKVRRVRMPGVGEVPWFHEFGVLTVRMPEMFPVSCIPCLAIELDT